jgi:hypothetical protein
VTSCELFRSAGLSNAQADEFAKAYQAGLSMIQ